MKGGKFMPTIIVGSIVAIMFVAIIVNEIKKKKSGKGGCSCGGNCGACGMNCPSKQQNK